MWRVGLHSPNSNAIRAELDEGEYALGPGLGADLYAPFVAVLELTQTAATLIERDGRRHQLNAEGTELSGTQVTATRQQVSTGGTRSLRQSPTEVTQLRLSHAQLGDFIVGSAMLRIGQDAGNDVMIETPYASKFHCEVFFDKGTHWVRDLNSKNGTRIDGRKVAVAELVAPAILRVADQDFSVTSARNAAEALVHQSDASQRMYEKLLADPPARKMIVFSGLPGSGRRFMARVWHETHQGAARSFALVAAPELVVDDLAEMKKQATTFVLEDLDLAAIDVRLALRQMVQDAPLGWLATSKPKAFVGEPGFTEWAVPPLSERAGDIADLAAIFVSEAASSSDTRLNNEAIAWLKEAAPAHTARELRQLITKAAAVAKSLEISPVDLGVAPKGLASAERDTIIAAMKKHPANMREVAQELGIARSTLYRKLDEHGISRSAFKKR